MDRTVAVLSDIHGVLPALDAVLADPDVRAAAHIVVTGDHAAGPQPVETLDRLVGLGERLTLVRGNADRDLVELAAGRPADPARPDEPAYPIDAYAAGRLRDRPDLVAVLAALPHPVQLDVPGFGAVVFCHGSPRDDDEVLLVDTRPERWAEAFAELAPAVRTVVCGHTHMPFARLVDRRLVVNPGSVGMPYGAAGAHWALLHDGAVTLRRTDYDVAAARTAIGAACAFEGVQEWTDYYLNARASDLEALQAFGPRDGRAVSSTAP